MKRLFIFILVLFSVCIFNFPIHPDEVITPEKVRSLRIVILSTMLADEGFGEWGFAALVEADGNRILFDTGAHPDTVLKNAKELGIDLVGVKDVVLSHHHDDHTGGLLTLRSELSKQKQESISVVHVGEGIFLSRPGKDGTETNILVKGKNEFESSGGKFVVHSKPAKLLSGVWLTGLVPRKYPEKNYPSRKVKTNEGIIADIVPEDLSMVIQTDKGLVVITGCGHSGIVNLLDYSHELFKSDVYAAIGGFHLFALDDTQLDWTAAKLKEFGVQNFVGAHCTGIEAVFHMRKQIPLTRGTCVVGSVGSSFTLDKGIDPLKIAK
ncbi:MAG TPA: MBL fold metallo-hydrolase [Acidobacteriota bacterium]|nr:MBL fold metallo-hydrolase [Acidobacteriota bacterium]